MIEQVQNGDSGLTVRTAINQAISKVNYAGTQLLASASVNLNLPDVPLPYPRLSYSVFDSTSNTKLTYTMGPSETSFIVGELVVDDNGDTGTIFYNSASTMSLAYVIPTNTGTASFAPGLGFTGSVSANTATVVTAVSGNLLTPGESIISVNLSSSATVVTSQSGSYTYGAYSELTSITGSFTVSTLSSGQNVFNPWQPGETINDTTSGASATLIYQYSTALVVRNVTGSFTSGDTISGSLSSNSVTLNGDLQVGYSGNVVVGQTSKVAFPTDNYFTSSHTDTTIILQVGTKFVVTDVLMTNAVGTYVSASAGPYLFTSPYQGGDLIAYGISQFNQFPQNVALYTLLQSPNIYINNIGNNYNFQNQPAGIALPSNITVGSTLYYSNVPNSSSATADVYVYGYILS
jgi:hypothetical protein